MAEDTSNYEKWGVSSDKEVSIAFLSNTKLESISNVDWGAWRNSSTPGMSVSKDVRLVLTEPIKVKSNITYETNDADNIMNSGPGKMITDFTQSVNGAIKSAAAISNVIGKGSAHGGGDGEGQAKRNGQAKTQLQSGLNALAMDATEGKYASRYQHFKVAKGAKSGGISSLTFSFKWGNADLYDSWEEVVKPILLLSYYLQPRWNSNELLMPFPNYYQYQTAFYKSLASTISNNISGLESAADIMAASEKAGGEKGNDAYSAGYATGSNSGQTEEERQKQEQEQKEKEEKEQKDKNASNSAVFSTELDNNNIAKASSKASTALKAMNSLVSSMWAACDDAVVASVKENGFAGFLYVKVGKSIWGPYTVQQADWEYDFTNVDENGFPIAGTISFSNIETLRTEDYDETKKHWTKISGKTISQAAVEYNKSRIDLLKRDNHSSTNAEKELKNVEAKIAEEAAKSGGKK